MPRNPRNAAYVALSPTTVAYTAEDGQSPEAVLLDGDKCVGKKLNAGAPVLIKLAKPGGFSLFSPSDARAYTPLNFAASPPQPTQGRTPAVVADGSGSPNQESSFV